MEAKDRIKDITFSDDAHLHIAEGVRKIAEAVGSTYGPGAGNVLTQKKYVDPILTRDGVTVAREIAGHGNKLKHPIENAAARLVYQASEKTNKTAGDGTSATVVLLEKLYISGRKRVVAGENPMLIKKKLDLAAEAITEFVKSKSQDCDTAMLQKVATISCGDPELGALVADVVAKAGEHGVINITYQNPPLIDVEEVTGYRFDQGFRELAAEAEIDEPYIFVTQKRLASRADVIPILELSAQEQKPVVIVGDVSGPAYETLVSALAKQQALGFIIPPPAFGPDGHQYFEDIAAYVGGRVWLEAENFKDVSINDFGRVQKMKISRDNAVLYGFPEQDAAVGVRILAIEKDMERSDITPSLKETLESRRAKLAGKVSIIRVGAATDLAREELFFRVEDAVEACKSALSSGIVAGGATTLLFAGEQNFAKDVPGNGLDTFIVDALQQPFRLLMDNAAEDAGYRLQQVLKAGYGKGFNLRLMEDKPIDLIKAGIVDPTKVVLQVVANAFANAGALLTTGAVITEEDHELAQTPQN